MDYKEKSLTNMKTVLLGSHLLFAGFILYALLRYLGVENSLVYGFFIVVMAFGGLFSLGGMSFDVLFKHTIIVKIVYAFFLKAIALFVFINIYALNILDELFIIMIVFLYVLVLVLEYKAKSIIRSMKSTTLYKRIDEKAKYLNEESFLTIRLTLRSLSRMLFLGVLYFFIVEGRSMGYHGVFLGIILGVFLLEYKRQLSFHTFKHIYIYIHGGIVSILFSTQFILIHLIDAYNALIHWSIMVIIFTPLMVGHIVYHTRFKNHVYKANLPSIF